MNWKSTVAALVEPQKIGVKPRITRIKRADIDLDGSCYLQLYEYGYGFYMDI